MIDWGGGVFASTCCGSTDGHISIAAPLALARFSPAGMRVGLYTGWLTLYASTEYVTIYCKSGKFP